MTARLPALCLAVALAIGPAHAADPNVPIGQDPGGTAITVVGSGIDYTRHEIAARLARDGEGEIIAWDFIDADHRPFDANAASFANRVSAGLSPRAKVRLIPVRADTSDRAWLGRASAFAARTPATIVLAEIDAPPADTQAAQLAEIARHFAKISFVLVAGGDAVARVKEASAGVSNVGLLSADFCTGSGGARGAVAEIGALLCTTDAFNHAD